MQIIGRENFTPEIVEYLQSTKKKAAIEILSEDEAEKLGFKHKNARVSIDYNAINHILKRHGAKSKLVKESGQEPITFADIANYRNFVETADETLKSVDKYNNNVLISFKQVNGYFVVIEQTQKKNNELVLKTLFKEKGNYKESKSYKYTIAKAQMLSLGYEPSANNSFALASVDYNTKPAKMQDTKNIKKYSEIEDKK